jgi:hypothetical protein
MRQPLWIRSATTSSPSSGETRFATDLRRIEV